MTYKVTVNGKEIEYGLRSIGGTVKLLRRRVAGNSSRNYETKSARSF